MICTMGFLPWFIINSLKETDWLRSLKNKLLANFPVTVLSTLCFECCRHGMHAICSWYVVVLFRSSVLQRMEHIERSIRFVGRGGVASQPQIMIGSDGVDESCPLAARVGHQSSSSFMHSLSGHTGLGMTATQHTWSTRYPIGAVLVSAAPIH